MWKSTRHFFECVLMWSKQVLTHKIKGVTRIISQFVKTVYESVGVHFQGLYFIHDFFASLKNILHYFPLLAVSIWRNIIINPAFENLELSIDPMSINVKIWTLNYASSFQNGIKPNAKLFQLMEVEYKCNIQTFYHSLFSFINLIAKINNMQCMFNCMENIKLWCF